MPKPNIFDLERTPKTQRRDWDHESQDFSKWEALAVLIALLVVIIGSALAQQIRSLGQWLALPWSVVGLWSEDYADWRNGGNIYPLRPWSLTELFFGLLGVAAEVILAFCCLGFLLHGFSLLIVRFGDTPLNLPSLAFVAWSAAGAAAGYFISAVALEILILFGRSPRPLWNQ